MIAFYTALISSMLVSNVILAGSKGLCSYLGVSKKWSSALGMGFALTVICVLSGLVCYGLSFLLRELGIYSFMFTVVSILVIASMVQITEIVIKKFFPGLYKSLGIYLPLITTNCVVLGLALSVGSYTDPAQVTSFGTVLGSILGVPLGFFLVIMLFSALRERLESSDTPVGFRGIAIGLIATAFMALAFTGLSGVI